MKRHAFTLIELLVVISIIALLLSILMPGLNMAKKKASSVVCSSNAKQLSVAWFMYQEDNDGRLCSSSPNKKYAWVEHPQDQAGNTLDPRSTTEVTDADEIRGIERGVLYPYYEASEVLHCPGDKIRKSKYDGSKIFRTYSMPSCLNFDPEDSSFPQITKMGEITSPVSRVVFVEEADYRNYNIGPWSFGAPEIHNTPGEYRWWDPMAVNHGDSSILGFCDGHSERHKWRMESTKQRIIDFANDPTRKSFGLDSAPPVDGTEDVDFMGRGWAYRRR
jgi:prepilin-type N-terminal cleavage/methylation domain-containing protein